LLARIDILTKDKHRLEQELRQAEMQADQHQRKAADLSRKLESIEKARQSEKDRLEDEVNRLTHRLQRMQPLEKTPGQDHAQQLKDVLEREASAKETIAALQGEKKALLDELETLQDLSRTGNDSKMQLHALRAEKLVLTQELDSMTRKYEQLEHKFKELAKTPVSRLKGETRRRSNSVVSTGSNDSVPRNEDDVQQYLEGLESGDADALEELKELVHGSQQELLRLTELVDQANEKELEWEGQLNSLQSQLASKTEEAQSLREQVVKLRTRLDSSELMAKKKEMEVEAFKDQVDELNELLSSSDENRESALQDLREVQFENCMLTSGSNCPRRDLDCRNWNAQTENYLCKTTVFVTTWNRQSKLRWMLSNECTTD